MVGLRRQLLKARPNPQAERLHPVHPAFFQVKGLLWLPVKLPF